MVRSPYNIITSALPIPGWLRRQEGNIDAWGRGASETLGATCSHASVAASDGGSPVMGVQSPRPSRDIFGENGPKDLDALRNSVFNVRSLASVLRPPGARKEGAAALKRTARGYADTQLNYSGNRSFFECPANYFRGKVRGRVPYWDVQPGEVGAEIVGWEKNTPFHLSDGRVRVYSHFAATDEHARLKKALGRPSGYVDAQMTSAVRTLVLLPAGGEPFMMKFSFPQTNNPRLWEITGMKQLAPEHVRLSVARSWYLRHEPYVTSEPSGMIIKDLGCTALYRRQALPKRRNLSPHDRVFTAHVLLDQRFAATACGRKIFARHNQDQEEWLTRELAPKLAHIVYRGLDKCCMHLELHAQNVDVVVSAQGKVREVLVKDLLDGMYDPIALAARGKTPRGIDTLRRPKFGNLGEPSSRYTAATLHQTYLGQLHYPRLLKRTEREPQLHAAVREELLKIIERRHDVCRLRRYDEYKAVYSSDSTLWTTIEGLRSLLIKANLETTFRPNPAVKESFIEAAENTDDSPKPHAAAAIDNALTEYGYAGGVPVAIARGADGTMLDYRFNLAQAPCRDDGLAMPAPPVTPARRPG